MSDQTTPLPPAGWYADPENPAAERWWNGSTWGDQRRASTLVPPVPAAPEPVAPVMPPIAPAPVAPSAVDERPNPYATPSPYATPAPSPYAGPPRPPNPNPTALVGFIISMSAILLNLIFTGLVGIAGGIVSAIGLSKANRLAAQGVAENGRGLAIAGTIVGFATGGFTILVGVVVLVITYPAR